MQVETIQSSSLFETTIINRGLFNPFTNQKATQQQSHDLLNFRQIGQEDYELRIANFILRQPSVEAPNRNCRMQTFSVRQVKTRRVSQLEKDKCLIIAAMKKKMQYSKKTGRPIDKPGEQLLEYPVALCDHDGKLLKGQKSYTTNSLEARYKTSQPPVFTAALPTGWRPQCSLIEGMFLINTTPLSSHKTISDYAKFLLKRYVVSQFSRGSEEVHDHPGHVMNTPKFFEHQRRDASATVTLGHCCDEVTSNTKIPPQKWRENCRECKQSLVRFVGTYFLNNIGTYLQPQQTLYVAGAYDGVEVDTAWFVRGNNCKQPDPAFSEETDIRLWLHARKTSCANILIMSPDTE